MLRRSPDVYHLHVVVPHHPLPQPVREEIGTTNDKVKARAFHDVHGRRIAKQFGRRLVMLETGNASIKFRNPIHLALLATSPPKDKTLDPSITGTPFRPGGVLRVDKCAPARQRHDRCITVVAHLGREPPILGERDGTTSD